MTFEVLVATMGQKDLSQYRRMNLRCDTLIANQCDRWQLEEEHHDFGRVRMLSSDTRGVGRNRNLGLAAAEGDIILFADDDIVYYDSTLQGVKDAFRELPDADVICFSIDMTRNGEVFDRRRSPVKRLHLWNALKYGTCRMAVRRAALEKHNIHFSTIFGGGCVYGSGEDSLLLRDCFRVGLRVYSHSYVLGACSTDSSTWFSGYNEKFMFDKGAWVACAFPGCKHLIKWYFIRKFSQKSELSTGDVIRQFNAGIRAFEDMRGFAEAARNEQRGG